MTPLELMRHRNDLMHSEESIDAGRTFAPRPTDVFVVTYPKSVLLLDASPHTVSHPASHIVLSSLPQLVNRPESSRSVRFFHARECALRRSSARACVVPSRVSRDRAEGADRGR